VLMSVLPVDAAVELISISGRSMARQDEKKKQFAERKMDYV
jgi:hypothetical protein